MTSRGKSIVDRVADDCVYPCIYCDVLRTREEGGAMFTVCNECWLKNHQPRPQRHHCIGCGTLVVDAAVCEECWDKRHTSIGAKFLSATREQLIEEVLRLRGELAAYQRKASK
jgi:hypothetical protein